MFNTCVCNLSAQKASREGGQGEKGENSEGVCYLTSDRKREIGERKIGRQEGRKTEKVTNCMLKKQAEMGQGENSERVCYLTTDRKRERERDIEERKIGRQERKTRLQKK